MFCPNCGKDAGEFRFCPHCGTGMPELKAAVWSVGMPCPHCGGTKLEGKDCAFCGARLVQEEIAADEDSFEIPYGMYGRGASWLMLSPGSVTYTLSGLFKQNITIPYEKITKIVYVHPGKNWGRLEIHWNKEEDVRVSGMKTNRNYVSDNVRDKDYDVFYHLGWVLKQLAPASELVIEGQWDEQSVRKWMEELVGTVDMDGYFDEFNPHRQQAWEAIYERKGIHARTLIHSAFDRRQRELYAKDPALAVRDLNRAIKEKKRREEILEQESKEREAQRRARRR